MVSNFSWYHDSQNAAAVPPEVAEQALAWLLELQDTPASPETEQAWRQWRQMHPDHERAWKRIESVQGKLRSLASSGHSSIARATLAPGASENRRRAIKTLSLLLFAGGAAWTAYPYTPLRAWTSDHHTAVGQRRALDLPDGTQVVLNTDSAIDLRFTRAERRVILVSGEILIKTAADPARPFVVETAQGAAQALGTEYAVRQHTDDTEISVLRGAVRIRPNRNPSLGLIVQAGYRVRYTTQTITPPDVVTDDRIAWKDGFIVARGMPLGAFIAELNRYTRDTLVCDPGIAARRVSGSFPVDDVGKVLTALAATLGLTVQIHNHFWRRRTLNLVNA